MGCGHCAGSKFGLATQNRGPALEVLASASSCVTWGSGRSFVSPPRYPVGGGKPRDTTQSLGHPKPVNGRPFSYPKHHNCHGKDAPARAGRPVRGEPLPLRMCATSTTVEVGHRRGNSPLASIKKSSINQCLQYNTYLPALYSRQFTFAL